MGGQVGTGGGDAAAVGLAFAYPEGLRGQLAALAAAWAPVDEAVAAGAAGLVELGLVTAGLNGSVAMARPVGAGRVRRGMKDEVGGSGRGGERATVLGAAGSRSERSGVRGVVAPGGVVEAGLAPEVVVGDAAGALESGAGAGPDGTEMVAGVVMVQPEAGVAPVGVGAEVEGLTFAEPGDLGRRRGLAAVSPVVDRGAGVPGAVAARAAAAVAPLVVVAGSLGLSGSGERGAAPISGGGAGLRADVGRVLRERAAVAGVDGAPEVLGGVEAAASLGLGVGAAGRGSAGRDGGLGFADGPGRAGMEAAWAPQPAERGSGGGGQGMGSVMLDGRLVGHWLGEGMAREAGRPGAGTTFFDPRQAPAWTPSGAL